MGVPEDAVDKTERVSTDCPPVVLIVFNRPDLTEQVFAAVRQARPRQLLVVADGPRDTHPADVDLCAATRAAVAEVDWPCDVLRRYSERNLGCGPAVSGGIGWALDQVGEALILEDDCLPDHSLFAFCAELLDRYRSDDRVMQIAGHNWAAPSDGYLGYSYAFNAFSPIWGWATWRRAWEKYDFHMRTWPQFRESGMLRGLPFGRRGQAVLSEYWNRAHEGRGTWDHQWQYAVMSHDGLSVSPSVNMVSNLGFRADATQTVLEGDVSHMPMGSMPFPLRHPPFVAENPRVEEHFERVLVEHTGRGVELLRTIVPSHRLRRLLKRGLHAARRRPAT
ncbi:MAG: glycosyltransferase family 2 protein [Actinobacteria bacterium]|nr:MAG: glycosyltransferase family 2 protein [Actinomycetota bacterium]